MFRRHRKARLDALATLRSVYDERRDLQQAFPEAKAGKYGDLLTWAAAASNGEFKDASRRVLAPYAEWYNANKPDPVVIPWPEIEKTSSASVYPSPITLEIMQDPEARDISHHLPLLFFLVVEFRLKNIVELGTRTGNSSLTLLEAAQYVGGRVLSVDIQPCLEAQRRIHKTNLAHLWTFIHANDLELELDLIPRPIDLLFVDTNHQYQTTIQELNRYGPLVRTGSWIVLHDYTSFTGVAHAVEEFVSTLVAKQHFHPFIHQNGLAVLRLS